MKPCQTTLEKQSHGNLFGGESAEEKWALRLFCAMFACMMAVCALHAIGQVMFIARLCA